MEATKKIVQDKETWKVANGEVVIVKGEIQNNPFSNRLQSSQAVQWMIQNEELVKRQLSKFLGGVQGGDEQDCFDFGLEYFTSKSSRVFKKNYHGKGTSYNVAQYVLSQLYYVASEYKNKLQLKGFEVQPILNREESLRYMGSVLDTVQPDGGYETPETIFLGKDEGYWDAYFDGVHRWFYSFVVANKYRKFKTDMFMYAMWLVNHHEDVAAQISSAAMMSGMSTELADLVVKDLRKAVRDEREGAEDFLEGLKELIGAIQNGWLPKVIRESGGASVH